MYKSLCSFKISPLSATDLMCDCIARPHVYNIRPRTKLFLAWCVEPDDTERSILMSKKISIPRSPQFRWLPPLFETWTCLSSWLIAVKTQKTTFHFLINYIFYFGWTFQKFKINHENYRQIWDETFRNRTIP